ncbi:MAG: OFA family MFS transporter [Sulfolobales archaeon]|nr:OFA family MFS transporter [Sulfolobales archaeon]MCX8208527.1 OFA family MFS transporter [Sulfolobales archaeon]MDW8010800.1 OFA family MFS transporter [Sulfolobales archaeon]
MTFTQHSVSRRYGYVSLAAGAMITAVLGSTYAYSVYVPTLERMWGSAFYASLPFSVLIAMFALTSILGGRLYSMRGIKLVAASSMLTTSVGLLLSSLVELVISPLWLIFTYGVLVGTGNGLGYVPTVALARRWFPDRAGLATGIVILGYGGSAIAFAPVKTVLVGLYGIAVTFLAVGLISLAVGVPAALLIRDPPREVVSYYSKFSKKRAILPKRDTDPREASRTIDFWLLWLSFLLVSGAGLMLIGHLARFALSRGLGRAEAALAISLFSLMNALGRPPAGWISDRLGRFGRPITMTALFAVQALLFSLLALAGEDPLQIYLIVSVAGFVYGSTLALYPAATGDFFGLKYLSENYALIFTGWGISGLIFPALGGYIRDVTGGYEVALLIASAVSLVGALMCVYLKKRLALYLE